MTNPAPKDLRQSVLTRGTTAYAEFKELGELCANFLAVILRKDRTVGEQEETLQELLEMVLDLHHADPSVWAGVAKYIDKVVNEIVSQKTYPEEWELLIMSRAFALAEAFKALQPQPKRSAPPPIDPNW
jgi:hypothetical protein